MPLCLAILSAVALCSAFCAHTALMYCGLLLWADASAKKRVISASYEVLVGSYSTLRASVCPSPRQTVEYVGFEDAPPV